MRATTRIEAHCHSAAGPILRTSTGVITSAAMRGSARAWLLGAIVAIVGGCGGGSGMPRCVPVDANVCGPGSRAYRSAERMGPTGRALTRPVPAAAAGRREPAEKAAPAAAPARTAPAAQPERRASAETAATRPEQAEARARPPAAVRAAAAPSELEAARAAPARPETAVPRAAPVPRGAAAPAPRLPAAPAGAAPATPASCTCDPLNADDLPRDRALHLDRHQRDDGLHGLPRQRHGRPGWRLRRRRVRRGDRLRRLPARARLRERAVPADLQDLARQLRRASPSAPTTRASFIRAERSSPASARRPATRSRRLRDYDGAAACGSPTPPSPALGCFGKSVFTCSKVVYPNNKSDVAGGRTQQRRLLSERLRARLSAGADGSDRKHPDHLRRALPAEPDVAAEPPQVAGVAPSTCPAAGAATPHECRYWWWLENTSSSSFPDALSNTMGFCIDYTKYTGDKSGAGTAPYPSCTTLSYSPRTPTTPR